MKNKKKITIIFSLLVLAITFSPYTITRLTSYGQELLIDNSKYQISEKQVQEYQEEERKLTQELAQIDQQIVSSTKLGDNASEDLAIAPGKIEMKVILSDEKIPNFDVTIKFVSVGGKVFETKINKKGQAKIELTAGRYYTEIVTENKDYRMKGDAPVFFLNAGEEKDLGKIYLFKM